MWKMKLLIILPIIVILSLFIYPSIANFLAYTPPREKSDNRLQEIATEFDFERFVSFLQENNIQEFNYEIFLDYITQNNIKLSEKDFRYLFDLISSAIKTGIGFTGLGENIGVSESVSFVLERKYFFGLIKLPVQTNLRNIRTYNKVFFYSIYFLIVLFLFLCFKGIIFRGKETENYINPEDIYPY